VNQQQHLHACLLPDFHLHLKTTSLLGSRAKLQGESSSCRSASVASLFLYHADLVVDIPKLEQLILSRLRAVIQDRLVHPNHLTLALPRFLSSSVSAGPIINDIGESAVSAMGDVMKQGFNPMVGDFSGGSFGQADGESYVSQEQSIPPDRPLSPPRISQKKITMPAGFPHSAYASSSSHAMSQSAGPPLPRRPTQQYEQPPQLSATSSSRCIPQSQIYGRATSTAPSSAEQSQNYFRFRGQFSSQPGTPGPGVDSGMYGEARRVGVLNARAG